MAFGADERRRLIYELLIEAKNIQEQRRKVEQELEAMDHAIEATKDAFKELVGSFAVAEVVKQIGELLGEVQKMSEQLSAIGLSGKQATQAFKDIEDTALITGQSVSAVSAVYQQAVLIMQKLGGTQADAAKLADAFTRSMITQGKSAQDASAQLETLRFAAERGSLKVKELQTLFKDNVDLQTAAHDALSSSTQQLVQMAEAGRLGADEIKRMLESLEKIGEQRTVGFTMDRLIESAKTFAGTILGALAEASGAKEALAKGFDPEKTKESVDKTRRQVEGVAGLSRAMVNAQELQLNALTGVWRSWTEGGREKLIKNMTGEVIGFTKGVASLGEAAGQEVKDNALLGDGTAANLEEMTTGLKGLFFLQDQHGAIGSQFEKLTADPVEEFLREGMEKAKKEIPEFLRDMEERIEGDFRDVNALEREREAEAKAARDKQREAELQAQEDFWNLQGAMLDEAADKRKATAEEVAQFADVLGSQLENVFTLQTHNAREFFASLARGFAQLLASQAAQKIARLLAGLVDRTGLIGMDLGTLGAGDVTPGPPGVVSAHGNAFLNGELLRFARGGVVTQPTVFPMARGAGLMGEAGAEAVMPLRRMSDGNLGVASATPAITIVNATGVNARASVLQSADKMQIVLEAAQLGAQLAEDRMTRSIRSGYGATASSLQRTYALRRGGGV
jgi:tape measure protein